MSQGLGEEDAAEVLLVGELGEHGGRGAPHGEAEVAGIDEVDDETQTVDDDEYPAAELLVGGAFLRVPGQEHQHDIRDVGEEDGGGVEDEAAAEDRQQIAIGEIGGVDKQVDEAGQEIDDVGQQQVDDGNAKGCQEFKTLGYLHHKGLWFLGFSHRLQIGSGGL